MSVTARAAAIAVAACASVGLAAGVSAATPLTPAQLEAAQQAASLKQVPFDLPLDGAVGALTGQTTSTSAVSGTLPAAPVLPPSETAPQDHQLLPDPVVPALNTTRGTPGLAVATPVTGAQQGGSGALGVALPSAPLRATGAAASLGHPLSYGSADGRDGTGPALDLSRLDPTLTEPQVQSTAVGSAGLTPDAGTPSLLRRADTLVAPVGTTMDELNQ